MTTPPTPPAQVVQLKKEQKAFASELIQEAKGRRDTLMRRIKSKYGEKCSDRKKGLVCILGKFESDNDYGPFTQDSTFYYMTGLHEPGAVLTIDTTDNKSTLYLPKYYGKWHDGFFGDSLVATEECASKYGFDKICFTGDEVFFQASPFFEKERYKNVIEKLEEIINVKGTIFSLNPAVDPPLIPIEDSLEDIKRRCDQGDYIAPRQFLKRLAGFVERLEESVVDISPLTALMRRKKDDFEIRQMKKALEITAEAHKGVARFIAPGKTDLDVRAFLEAMYIVRSAKSSYEHIISTRKKNLHWGSGESICMPKILKDGDLILIDSGAQYRGYCADITRTFPVSGKFTKLQKKIYNFVLELQEYIVSIAKPGYYLSNFDEQEKSLRHIYQKRLEDYGFEFIHGIGHFLGLDPHDAGRFKDPLEVGDFVTVEPGVYLEKGSEICLNDREEIVPNDIVIRIEDVFVMTEKGLVCLYDIPKKAEHIEAMMQRNSQ